MTTTTRVFITGGASGLGKALAQRWIAKGARVAIADRNRERGNETARELGATFFACDVTDGADVERVAKDVVAELGGVDVVVNNAGVASGGKIDDIPLEEWKRVVDVNLMGVVHGCRAFVPILKRQGAGSVPRRIVNVASLAGLVHLPRMSTYNATKAAVVALSETLRAELAQDGIGVSVVCPSFFKTNLIESMAPSTSADVVAQATKLVNESGISADVIAGRVIKSVERGEFLVLTHRDGAAAYLLKRMIPTSAWAFLLDAASKRVMNANAMR